MKARVLVISSIIIIIFTLGACTRRHKQDSTHYFQDFETVKNWYPNTRATNEIPAHTGKFCAYTDTEFPYSPTFLISCKDVPKQSKKVRATAWLYLGSSACMGSFCFQIVNPQNSAQQWNAVEIANEIKTYNKWTRLSFETTIDETKRNPENTLTIFVWNTKSERIFLDDVEVEFLE